MVFLHAFGGIFSLLIVVALGYLLAAWGWFPQACRKLLPKLVTNISLPPFLACTIISSFQRDQLLHLLYGALLPLISMILLFVFAYIIGKLMVVNSRHFGLFCACVSNSNTIFIGIPVNLALFGQEALPYALIYYFAATLFFWTVGNYFISRDQTAEEAKNSGLSKKLIHWDKIISPPMYGFLSALGIICLDLPVPEFIFNAARLTGEMTTPLALIFIGITLQGIGLKNLRIDRDMSLALVGRMIISPALILFLLPFFNLPELMGKVFVIQASLPVLMQVAILSAYYNTDPDFGSIIVSLSTILCVLTVPLLMVIL